MALGSSLEVPATHAELTTLLLESLLCHWTVPSEEHSPSVLLCGPSGSGKSFLLHQAVQNVALEEKDSDENPRIQWIKPSLAEASVFHLRDGYQTTLRRIIHRDVLSNQKETKRPGVLLLELDHLEVFCAAGPEGSSSDAEGVLSSSSTPHAALITDLFTVLRASPPLFTAEELEMVGISRIVLVGCFAGEREEVHPLLQRAFDVLLSVPTPTEKERHSFFRQRSDDWRMKEEEETNAWRLFCAQLADAIALRAGGVTYQGLVEIAEAVPSHVEQWTLGSRLPDTSREEESAALAQRVVQEFHKSSSIAASMFRRSAGYVDVQVTRWSDIAGLYAAKEALQQIVMRPLQHQAVYNHFGVQPSTGVLLYGPPGTGKTMLAKAMATELNASFVYMDLPGLIKAEVGESEKKLTAFFAAARERSPSVVFMDEIQAAFGVRYQSGHPGSSRGSFHESRLVSHLLYCIDAAREDPDALVVVVGATNLPDHLDPSLLRAGRLDTLVAVPLPEAAGRAQLIQRVVLGDWAAWFRPPAAVQSIADHKWITCLEARRGDGTPTAEALVRALPTLLEGVQKALISTFVAHSEGFSGAELKNVTTIFATEFLQRFLAHESTDDFCGPNVQAVFSILVQKIYPGSDPNAMEIQLSEAVKDSVLHSVQRLRESKPFSTIYA